MADGLPPLPGDPPKLQFFPPLCNSASPWATTKAQLRRLLICPSIGAITTRTSMIGGYPHDSSKNRLVFFDPTTGCSHDTQTYSLPDDRYVDDRGNKPSFSEGVLPRDVPDEWSASLNNLGYSPYSLATYLDILRELSWELHKVPGVSSKVCIVSITGAEHELRECYQMIYGVAGQFCFRLAMEVNLSCPNIKGSSPLAYDWIKLARYIRALPAGPRIPVGIKVPPYTYEEQFVNLASALKEADADDRISFITTCNTLGNCLVINDGPGAGEMEMTLPNGGMGGMAGPPLHPLALGNVNRLSIHIGNYEVIGVGGVSDGKGYKRMRAFGATFVALATALGQRGPQVFADIEKEIEGRWEDLLCPAEADEEMQRT